MTAPPAVEPQLRFPLRAPVAMIASTVAGLGLLVVGTGMTRLQWAHLYRQQSGEGIAFFQVALLLVGGGLLALTGATGLLLIALRLRGRIRRVLLFGAGAVVASLVVCAATALWVQGHGERCIGPCG